MNNKIAFIYMVFLVMGVLVFNGTVGQAAVIPVITTQDNVPGSLRAAITTANTNNENNTIYLPAGTYFLTGAAGDDANASGDLDININRKLTISGAGKTKTIIDGNLIDRVLHILNGTVSITDLTIRKGSTPTVWNLAIGGGGIYNCGNLTLTRCDIKENNGGDGGYGMTWYPGGPGGPGGGINNEGLLTLNNCTITGNRGGSGGDSRDNDAGDGGHGGGIYNYNTGILSLDNCTISNNKGGAGGESNDDLAGDGGSGGGIYNLGMSTLNKCIITGNRGGERGEFSGGGTPGISGDGGGVYNCGNSTLSGCTVSDNVSGSTYDDAGRGGGIFNNANGYLSLINCTISRNQTGTGYTGANGGGLYNGGNSQLIGVTLVDNTAGGSSSTDEVHGGGIFNEGSISLKNTIAANNRVVSIGYGPDCSGTFNWVAYSLIEDTSDCILTGFQKANIFGKDPLLGPLQDNGGPTYTHALLPGSPAIDAGNSCDLSEDQRGYTRPVDIPGIANVSDGADIGAYEFNTTCTISGAVTFSGTGIAGVTLTFSNNGGTTTTGTDGHYSHAVIYNWSGTVTPAKEGYTFTPSSRNYTNVITNQSNQHYTAALLIPPQISLNRNQLYFGANTSGKQTGPQSFLISNSGGGILNWTTAADANWLSCNPAAGTGPALVTISINLSGLAPGTYYGTIKVEDPHASNSPRNVTVTLIIYQAANLPWGSFDTPISGSTVTGSIPVTGWAIDHIGIENVKIYRNPVTGEGGGLVYIGDAIFVEGARPDIEAAFPGYPNNYKAGWGYLMLTNALPGQGNGNFTLYAKATDKEGNTVTLGSKTIKCDNAHAVKPFGALDTPAQGGAASGSSYVNFGWALTPLPNTIPPDGSTITVWVDGVSLGHPVYNLYRADIAALFPGYNNSDGALGYYYLDTTSYENGVHTISWSVKDNVGNTDGIGSRYFTIQNTEAASLDQESQAVFNQALFNVQDSMFDVDISQIPMDYFQPVQVKKGYNRDIDPQILYPDDSGNITIEINELERIEIYLAGPFESLSNGRYGYQIIEDRLKALPIGSSFNAQEGFFSWQPGPGFLGSYEFLFIEKTGTGERMKKHIIVRIASHSSSF